MSRPAVPLELVPAVRRLQVIVVSLAVGCAFFLVIVVATAGGWPAAWLGRGILTPLAVLMAGALVMARVVVGQVLLIQGRKKIADSLAKAAQADSRRDTPAAAGDSDGGANLEARLLALLWTRSIVGGAMMESAAFLLLVVAMIERTGLPLLLALVLIAGMLVPFPTLSRMREWLQAQQGRIEAERAFHD